MSTMSKVACLFTILRLSLANDVCSMKISRHYGHPSFQLGFFLTFILQVSGLKTNARTLQVVLKILVIFGYTVVLSCQSLRILELWHSVISVD